MLFTESGCAQMCTFVCGIRWIKRVLSSTFLSKRSLIILWVALRLHLHAVTTIKPAISRRAGLDTKRLDTSPHWYALSISNDFLVYWDNLDMQNATQISDLSPTLTVAYGQTRKSVSTRLFIALPTLPDIRNSLADKLLWSGRSVTFIGPALPMDKQVNW